MAKFIDRTGVRYGKLTAVRRHGTDALRKVTWECVCDCGGTTTVSAGALVTGNTTSCGCIVPNFKHGGWKNASYNTWRAMLRRCNNPKSKDYALYGALGITVCPEWHEYVKFVADMGEPIGSQTLDRINPYGGYEAKNCRWASITTQNRNLRIRPRSKTGVIGVCKTPSGKYMATVTVGRKRFISKVFRTVEEAATARKELERLHWGDV